MTLADNLRLGLVVGYWPSSGPPPDAAEQVAAAEALGYESIWTSEAYGSDCFTPLAWWGSATTRVKLGTAITQISARTPASTAMTAITLDHLSGGRLILGLGVSGPQVVEGWYGQEYAKPLARTREYVEIVRRIVARDEPVSFEGDHYAMPFPGGTGLGKPLKSIVRPLRTDIPIYLGAEGPKNVALAAEIGDGWLPMFFSPKSDSFYCNALAEGFARPGARRKAEDFEVACVVPTIPGDDIEACADLLRPTLALYIGGMGARDRNFHKDVFTRLGYEAECAAIQDAYLDGRKQDAAALVPTEMVEDVYLIGPPEKIREDLDRWRETCVTTLLVAGPPDLLRQIAELVG
ncbi:MAG TPA: LLM class F420-dependent oxidoreductase [Acidimicrobiales bacterium]